MNISQAKAVAGISKKRSVFGRKNLLAAIEQCKRGIIAAHPDRTGGNTSRAAELSEAQQVFKERLRGNRCQVSGCGQPISASATHCRMHSRAKASPLPKDFKPALRTKPGPRANSNQRVDVAPVGGPEAKLGYYTDAVQKVVKRWQKTIPDNYLRSYFLAVGNAVVFRETSLNLPFVPVSYWPAIWELGAAVSKVIGDQTKPASWILRHPGGMINGKQDSWGSVRDQIIKQGGPQFSCARLAQAWKRMKLTTPNDLAREHREAMRPRHDIKSG